ncbi:MAG: T9SS type A sorting domain-containing protein [Reichenbachiella sp.]|uniref:T9SS type A sorting domain-containing protein n=1 Tax=Reichenbachiella sp. TaxID=2184521 RepID=UPI00296724CA|nr:T9SS type A sorting domain-containing protein [Reichenbachiella sp.]MDW3208607.1 T9SS type A sorting domain-containing protein [Reichenbachiella sp.]
MHERRMIMVRISLFFLILLTLCQTLLAQVELEFIQPSVTYNETTLDLAFAGGINSAQYQTIDLDGDKDLDLILFDRSSDKINGFENTGDRYVYQAHFEFLFPEDIQHWVVLADYDCDGQKDLFTYTGQGIRVFKNLGTENNVSWQEIANPLKTQGSSSSINLFFNPTDIPSIADLDGDGDLDILVFDFASSSQIEFHQNQSIENTGACGLDFVRVTRTYGNILDCGCDAFLVNQPCPSSGRILHAGGKALLSLDYDRDGKMDLVLSQEACENLNYSNNIGTLTEASFTTFDNRFPSLISNIGLTSFPSAFFEDVTFDGKKDILVSSNERSNSARDIDFKMSSFLFENGGSSSENQFENSSVFLQDQMIDVGEFAYPAIVDVDGDGLNDLVIGNAGSLIDDEYSSTLTYYRASATGLEWQTDDLYGLSTLEYTEIKPQFIDLNNDQKLDLVFSLVNNALETQLAYILNQGESLTTLDPSRIQFLDTEISRLDDYVLDDIDEDGLPDLLLGLSNGQLNYYSNTGSSTQTIFMLDTENFLGLTADNDRSNLSIAIGDLDGNSETDLITTDRTGKIKIYSDYHSGNSSAQESLVNIPNSEVLVSTRLGRISKPASAELLGRNVIVIGSIQGGLRLLATSGTSGETSLKLKAFPVPSSKDKTISFQSNLSNTLVEIYSLAGSKVAELNLASYITESIDLSNLEDGLYLAKASTGNQQCTVKILLGGGN